MNGVKWHGSHFGKIVLGASNEGLKAAATALVGQLREVVGVPGFGVPSKHGESPRKQTKNLHDNIGMESKGTADEPKYHVGLGSGKNPENNVAANVYGLFLEVGTRFMAPRPWIRPTIIRFKDRLAKIYRDAALRA